MSLRRHRQASPSLMFSAWMNTPVPGFSCLWRNCVQGLNGRSRQTVEEVRKHVRERRAIIAQCQNQRWTSYSGSHRAMGHYGDFYKGQLPFTERTVMRTAERLFCFLGKYYPRLGQNHHNSSLSCKLQGVVSFGAVTLFLIGILKNPISSFIC